MNLLTKGVIARCATYILVFVGFLIVTSVAAASYANPLDFGKSSFLANTTLLSKFVLSGVPGAVLGRFSGREGIAVAAVLTLVAFVLGQILSNGLFLFSTFSGDPLALAIVYIAIAAGCAALTRRKQATEVSN